MWRKSQSPFKGVSTRETAYTHQRQGARSVGSKYALNWTSLYLNSCLVAFQKTPWVTLAEAPGRHEGKETGLGMRHCTSSLDFPNLPNGQSGQQAVGYLEDSLKCFWEGWLCWLFFCEQVTNFRPSSVDKLSFLWCSFRGFILKPHLGRF